MAETVKQLLPNNDTYQAPIRISSRDRMGVMYPSVKVIPTGGTCTVQSTSSTWDDIVANSASWDVWPSGAVGVNTSDSLLGAVTAVRAKATGGTGVLEVCQ